MSEQVADLHSEVGYLGSCMMDPSVIDTHPTLSADFYGRQHRVIFEAIVGLHVRGEEISTTAVRIELERRGAQVPIDLLLDLTSHIEPDPRACVQRIRELASRRRARDHAMLAAAAFAEGANDTARHELDLAAAESTDRSTDVSTAVDAVAQAITDIRDRARSTRAAFVATGIQGLDDVIKGYEYGDVWILGGDTSVGKSTTALYQALKMGQNGHRVGIVSMEDPKGRVGRRVLSMVSGVPAVALRSGQLSPWQWDALAGSVETVRGTNVTIAYCVDDPTLTAAITAVEMLRRDHACDVIILDYAQACRVLRMDERLAMREVVALFRAAVNKGAAPAVGILLSQLKRREDRIHDAPTKNDLAESAYLEQKADGIVLLWLDHAGITNGVMVKGKDDKIGARFAFERDSRGKLVELAA